ncbi:unnamed protein product, partial [Iphiclides podalirius]
MSLPYKAVDLPSVAVKENVHSCSGRLEASDKSPDTGILAIRLTAGPTNPRTIRELGINYGTPLQRLTNGREHHTGWKLRSGGCAEL